MGLEQSNFDLTRFAIFTAVLAYALARLWNVFVADEDSHFLHKVERVSWSSLNYSVADLVKNGRPVIIADSPALAWACSNWTAETFVESLEYLPGVKTSHSRVFRYYQESKPLRDLPQVQQRPEWNRENMLTDDFMKQMDDTGRAEYAYFSADLDSFPSLRRDLPYQPRVFKTSNENMLINVWLGGNGVVADAHYDTSNNFYYQIQQSKRFLVMPPTVRHKLGLYPFLHPSYRRAAKSLRANGGSGLLNYGLVQEVGALEATLGPGDVLYLPAYWLHDVEALTENGKPSISVNVWSDSKDYKAAEELFTAAVPFEEDWDDEELAMGLYTYAGMILDLLPSNERSDAIGTLKANYANVPSVTGQHKSVDVDCHTGDEDFKQNLEHGTDGLRFILRQFVNPSVRSLYVGYFIEVLANHCIGTENVKDFIDRCI